jgi:HlyD family secretion protein
MPAFPSRCLSLSGTSYLTALFLCGCSADTPIAKNEAGQQHVAVRTVAVEVEEVERTTTQPATVYPFYRAEMRARASGYISEVKADIGDYVKAGDTLALVAVPEMQKQRQVIQARILRHQAEEKRAEAGISLAEAQVGSAEAKLAQAKSQMSRVEASLAAIQAEFDRTQDLVQRQSLESRMLDEARMKRDSELANKDATASAINSAEAEVKVAEANRAAAEADSQAAQADTSIARSQLEELDVLLAYAVLRAPFDGLVTQRSVDPGDLVREGSEVGHGEPLFVVSQLETVRVHIPVPEAEAALIRRGDAITLTFPSFPSEQSVTASVTRASGDLDPSTRTMLVEAELPNPDRKLLPGMFGQATITLGTKMAANMLPARAVRFDESGGAYVYVVDDEATVTVAKVDMGIDQGHSIEVKSGVTAGQRVIDAHLKRFTTGQKVTLVQD